MFFFSSINNMGFSIDMIIVLALYCLNLVAFDAQMSVGIDLSYEWEAFQYIILCETVNLTVTYLIDTWTEK